MGRIVVNDEMWERACHAIPPHPEHAIAAMNRGHELTSKNDTISLHVAIEAYSEAIAILESLPDKTPHANSLGAALMNRGQLKHRIHGSDHADSTLADFKQAAATLRPILKNDSPWPRRNLVGTLINHANLLLDLRQPQLAKNKAEEALTINCYPDPQDPTDCELSILATRALCDAIGQLLPQLPAEEQDSLAAHASTRCQDALKQIRALRTLLTVEPFAEASCRLFHYGALLHATLLPKKLDRFIRDHFQDLQDRSIQPRLVTSSRHAIPLAVEQLRSILLSPDTEFAAQDQLAHTAQALEKLHAQLEAL